jgi:hypothetical protein
MPLRSPENIGHAPHFLDSLLELWLSVVGLNSPLYHRLNTLEAVILSRKPFKRGIKGRLEGPATMAIGVILRTAGVSIVV